MINERIEINPGKCAGKPVIKDTRIPVTILLEFMAAGESWESILKGYPELTRLDLQAALQYAVNSIEMTDVMPVFTGTHS